MKKVITSILTAVFALSTLWANDELKKDFITGDPDIKSIHALTFGPEGILFIGDSEAAKVVAIDMGNAQKAVNENLNIGNLEELLSDLLGSDSDQFQIVDMAVNPQNENIYIAVNHSSGKSLLFLVHNNTLSPVSLDKVAYSQIDLVNPVAADAKDRRGRSLRKWAISDLSYANGNLMLSGLSNAAFASTFRAIPFPFSEKQEFSSLEIYHATHGQYETNSPIKTFTTMTLNDTPHIIASYTCTPLVVFPMDQLKAGAHTKGRTVAELGNWNTPLDIIEMEKDGERYILLANTNRALMKINVSDIESFGNSLTARVPQRSDTAGVSFINLPFVNVQQLDKLNDTTFVMLHREANGNLALKTGNNRWL